MRVRVSERALLNGVLWRREGEFAAGGVCHGCGERVTSAQASYAVDFTPGVIPQSVPFHGLAFEIWQHECQTPLPGSARGKSGHVTS